MTAGRAAPTRSSYSTIELYAPDRRPCEIDVSDNTNLWGSPPSASRVLAQAGSASVTRYPELYADSLKAALAEYLGVGVDQIVTGCGSDDVLDSTLRAFADPGDVVAVPDPSFAAVPIFARMNSLQPVLVPLTGTYDIDVDGVLASNARIVYLCSPNNPTGQALSRTAIEAIVDRAPGLIIIDEAYAEFARASAIEFLSRSDRVLITRTMSKAFGLAGLRIGYAVGAAAVVREVEKSRGPYKVNAVAERAAVAVLRNDMPWVREHAEQVIQNRARLTAALRELRLTALPSQANFVLVPVVDATRVAAELRTRGVAVRPFERLTAAEGSVLGSTAGDALRITIGPWDVMASVLAALEEVLSCRV